VFDHLSSQRLLALFALGWLVLNAPLLALWDLDVVVLGVPAMPLAVYSGWAALIAAAAWIAERGGD
jgi:hypothetical protein